MSGICQVTGKRVAFGKNVSHSQRRTNRCFNVNLHVKTYYVPSLKRKVRLRVSAKGIKIIDVQGIDAVVSRLIREGVKL